MKFADLTLINGRIYSPDMGGNVKRGDTVLIRDGKIIGAGVMGELEDRIGEDTCIIDCGGNTILPGLCDAHCHPSAAAGMHSGCDLFGVYIHDGQSEDDVIDEYMSRLAAFIRENPGDELVRGMGWVLGNFPGERVPTRHDIDRVCSDRPVVLESFCQHNLWVNTKAIEMAGIDADTPDVYAGKIYREADGYPQGIFNDPEAMELIKKNVPGYDLSVEKYKEAFLHYQKEFANKYGVTLLQDCLHSDNAREAYRQLAEEGKLTLRVRGVYLLEPGKGEEQLTEAISRKSSDTDDQGDDFRIDTVKMFSEGLFSLTEPYEESFVRENGLPEGYNEPLYWEDEQFVHLAGKAMEAGFSVHVHAMGDNSVGQSVRCIATAQQEAGSKRSDGDVTCDSREKMFPRNVIAHMMLVHDDDLDLMAENHIMACCQPRWMVYDSDIEAMVPMMGKARAESAYPLRGLEDRGIIVSFGTDFPVTPPPDTMHEIQCAMTRTVFPDAPDYEKFKGRVLGDERPATLAEAVQALSVNGAYQMFLEDVTGTVETGKSADLVILDSDIENTDIDKIYDIKVAKTLFKGKVVYEKQ